VVVVFVHVPGMNGPNTRGLLGKGLSAPVTPAVFGPFMPGTCSSRVWRGVVAPKLALANLLDRSIRVPIVFAKYATSRTSWI